MSRLSNILQLFSPDSLLYVDQKENQDTFVLSAPISAASAPNADRLYEYLAGIPSQDKVEILFKGDVPDVTLRENTKEGCITFAGQIDRALNVDSTLFDSTENDFMVTLTITKERNGSALSLYSLDAFTDFLDELTVADKFAVFRNILARGNVTLHCLAKEDAFDTRTIRTTISNQIGSAENVDRKELIGKRDDVCHFRNGGEHQFIPDDFYMLKRSQNQAFNSIMDTLCFIVSVVYLADISDIESNTLSIRLNGYKVIAEKVKFPTSIENSLDEIFKLYSWAYSGGNISDKIGIIRNLISLYAKSSILKVEDGVYSAARSNYEIYLKENIGRYLEIKNNIANKILEMSQNCTKYIETFGSYFKQSIFAISSFFATIIVLAAIDKEKYGKVFSNDVRHISLGLILISFVHMVFTIIEYQKKCDRFAKEYRYLKETYKDVLDEKDIERIFDKDKNYNEDYSYLQAELAKYSFCWGIILLILLVLTLTASGR